MRQIITSQRVGITERKKAELDQLTIQVLTAANEVDQFQAIVDALTDKSSKFQQFLADADGKKTQALNNRNMLDAVLRNVYDLRNNSLVAFDKMVIADATIKEVAVEIKNVIDKLIFSAELVNKLSNLVIRQKALNPLISNDLMDRISAAGKDANDAVALALTALKSTFAAQATNMESEAATTLEYTQAIKLHEILSGTTEADIESPLPAGADQVSDDYNENDKSLRGLLYTAYYKAVEKYDETLKASNKTLKQLNMAITELTTAQIRLKSLQSGLAAANAAALAS